MSPATLTFTPVGFIDPAVVGVGGNLIGAVTQTGAPRKETWKPVEIRSDQVGTQVGPNGQYSLFPTPIGALIPQTSAGFAAGDITISTANKTVTGVVFTGKVTCNAAGITFNSCRFRGNQSTAGDLVSNFGANAIGFNDCWFDPTLPLCGNSLIGGYYTANRCEAWRTVDGFGPRNVTGQQNANAYHYNCYVHDLCAGLTEHSGGPSHNDPVQHQGGNNMEIIGCTLRGFVDHTFGDGASWNAGTANTATNGQRQFGPNYQTNSCVQTNQNNGKGITGGIKISYNDFDGGIFTINIGPGSFGQNVIDECIHNVFGHNQGGFPGNSTLSANNGGNNTFCFAPNSSGGSITYYTDNTYADNGVDVNPQGMGTDDGRFPVGVVVPVGAVDVARGEAMPVGAAPIANVGVRPGVSLTVHSGTLTLTSGQVVSGLDIHGSVTTSGSLAVPPTVTDCIIRGVPGTSADAGMALGNSYDLSGTVFEFCTFDATGNESGFLNGLSGGHFTVRYSEIKRAVDGAHVTGQGGAVTIEACRIYNGYYESVWNDSGSAVRTTTFTDFGGNVWTPPFADQAGSGDVHADGIQVFGSAGNPSHVIRGCYIGGANAAGRTSNDPFLDPTVEDDYNGIQLWNNALCHKNTAIILNPISTHVLTIVVELNWLHGGAAVLSASTNGTDTGSGEIVRNNRFIRAGSTGFIIYTQTTWTGTLTNNVFDDDGTPATVNHF